MKIKHILRLSLVFSTLCIAVLVFSCSKDQKEPAPEPVSDGELVLDTTPCNSNCRTLMCKTENGDFAVLLKKDQTNELKFYIVDQSLSVKIAKTLPVHFFGIDKIIEDYDKGFLITCKNYAGQVCDYHFMKLDSQGEVSWDKKYFSSGSYPYFTVPLCKISDNTTCLALSCNSKIVLYKFDQTGGILWQKEMALGPVGATNLMYSKDEKICMTTNLSDCIMLDSTGNKLWSVGIDISNGFETYYVGSCMLNDGSIAEATFIRKADGSETDTYFSIYDTSGNLKDQKNINSDLANPPVDFCEDPGKGFFILQNGEMFLYVIKIDYHGYQPGALEIRKPGNGNIQSYGLESLENGYVFYVTSSGKTYLRKGPI